ncbi:peptidoglycan D,D-transpeptidase FtsI family protein [Aerosakkonema sp. BLCC-F183]|uniref:peptidoglycan D,D-transpeptidase FtsI family protein n=1 Tax=Aerosakkonema sp. BLCC-F183 TaxID=3342834 RepID=UPI0035B7A819
MASPEPPSSRYAGRRRSRTGQPKLKHPSGRRKSSDKQQAQLGANLVAPIAKLRLQNISAWERKFGAKNTGKISAYSETHQRSHNPKSQPQQAPLHRIIVVWIVLIVSGLGLAWNLYRLQVVRGPVLEGRAKQQQAVTLRPYVPRRPIVDRNNNILAIDRPAYTLYAHPKLFKTSKQEVATKLSPLLGRSVEDLEKLFNKKKSGIRLENSLLEEVADRIVALRVDGLELLPHYSRLYPQQELAADIVGYVDMDHIGQAGVERSQQNLLERSIKAVRLSRTGNGAIMPDYAPVGVMNTDDLRLQLTVDSRLQRATRSALKEKIAQFQAKRGTAIVMDARDGSLLAMVSEPSYDPNHYSKYNVELFKNWALTDLYEPGSTFKPLNVAIALETGAISPDSTFVDNGLIRVAGWPIKNAEGGGQGRLTIAQILQVSSNVGMVQIVQQLKSSVYYGWLERLGLGQTVETDLPFETSSQLKSQEEFTSSAIEPATASFGQGFSITPLQLAQLHGAIANGGKLVSPHVVRGLFDSNGQMHWQPTLPAPRPIFSPKTTQTVLEMMETVVSKGTGKNAQIPGYRIAGKTGTAQKANSTGGYSANAKITSFVGILSVDSPRYVVVAVVDEPKGRVFGSTVAAPIVKSIMESLIAIEQIPPSRKGVGDRG